MVDPFDVKNSYKKARAELSILDFYTQVYPKNLIDILLEAIKNDENIRPHKCIFIPKNFIFQTMIRAILKFGHEDKDIFLARFGLVDMQR